jgi:hypothetical protein
MTQNIIITFIDYLELLASPGVLWNQSTSSSKKPSRKPTKQKVAGNTNGFVGVPKPSSK